MKIDIKIKDINAKIGLIFNANRHKEAQRNLVSLLDKAGLDNAIREAITEQGGEDVSGELENSVGVRVPGRQVKV